MDLAGSELGDGIGIHTGELSFGEFGRSHRDLTAIGTVVNTASRAQSAAGAAQILVTREVWHRAQPDLARSEVMAYQLKGFEELTSTGTVMAILSFPETDARFAPAI